MTTKKDLLRDDVITAVNRIFTEISEDELVAELINDFSDSLERINDCREACLNMSDDQGFKDKVNSSTHEERVKMLLQNGFTY